MWNNVERKQTANIIRPSSGVDYGGAARGYTHTHPTMDNNNNAGGFRVRFSCEARRLFFSAAAHYLEAVDYLVDLHDG